MTPIVSVVIPTFNRAKFVVRAVRSVVAQSFTHLEIIIVDDGSTDATMEKITQLSEVDPRIVVVRHSRNLGAQEARNTGIKKARGEYVAMLDSDDEWRGDKLARQIELFNGADPSLGVVYCGYRVVREGDQPDRDRCFDFRGDIYRQLLSGYGLGPTSILLVKKEALQRVGMFDPSVRAYQEWDICIRLAKHFHFDFIPEPLVSYHVHSGHSISRDRLDNIQAYLDLVFSHRSEILRVGGAHVLSEHNRKARRRFVKVGRRNLLEGDRSRASRAFLTAARLPPRSWKLLTIAMMVRIAPRFLWRLSSFTRNGQGAEGTEGYLANTLL